MLFFTMSHHVSPRSLCPDPFGGFPSSFITSYVYRKIRDVYSENIHRDTVVELKILLYVLHSESRTAVSSLLASINENGKTIERKR